MSCFTAVQSVHGARYDLPSIALAAGSSIISSSVRYFNRGGGWAAAYNAVDEIAILAAAFVEVQFVRTDLGIGDGRRVRLAFQIDMAVGAFKSYWPAILD